jgi:halocarboxylic acid dehydrogenase DehI
MSWKKHKLRLVKEGEAQGRTAEIYDEIRETMGTPAVNMMFQAFASLPEFFELFWKSAKPTLETQEFFSFSERLGAEAYTRVHNYFPVPDLRTKIAEMRFSPGAQSEILQVVDLYHYNYAVLLLLSGALEQAFENPGSAHSQGTRPALHPMFTARPILVDEEVAPAPTRKVYDEIKRTLGTPFLNTCFLNFGRWPDFLKTYWDCLKPILKTPLYEQHRLAMRESALTFATELPEPLQLSPAQMEDAGVPVDDVNAVVQMTDLFLNLLSKQVLNMAFAKIGLEDGIRSRLAA